MAGNPSELRRLRDTYRRRRERGAEDRYAPYEPANLFRLQRLERDIARLLRRHALLPWPAARRVTTRALDVGCGGGWWLRTLLRWGASPRQLAGVDALPDACAAARRVHPSLHIVQCSAAPLPFADAAFDLVSQFTVFSSILDPALRGAAAAEMLRVLRPGGVALWYDFTVNPTNRETHGIGIAEVRRLFPGCRIEAQRATLAPPLTRLVAPRSWLVADLLENIPILRTHLLIAIRKGAPSLPR